MEHEEKYEGYIIEVEALEALDEEGHKVTVTLSQWIGGDQAIKSKPYDFEEVYETAEEAINIGLNWAKQKIDKKEIVI